MSSGKVDFKTKHQVKLAESRVEVADLAEMLAKLHLANSEKDYWLPPYAAEFVATFLEQLGPACAVELVWCLTDWLAKYHPKFEEVRDIVNPFTETMGDAALPRVKGHAWPGRKNLPPGWNDGPQRGESIYDWEATQ